ncbi:thioredoxin-like domain-containing protein [Dysgonomonas sp. 25]|uniref:TlpA family protein disulfide reductase n=1 Tax=Dysgonomonas sp. 25 TaxID=2302933 RepID=UPI0013D1F7C9|nr:thioredoxin-like domain-containing protein [Dysgonomonas sp. 25]NDV67929.1 hypothetical protein [Dysgonomonas sp. 25]
MRNKTYILHVLVVILFLQFSCSNKPNGDEKIVFLKLQGKKYDQLWLRSEYLTLEKPYSNGEIAVPLAFEIAGESEDGYNWKFVIPDSLHNKHIDSYAIKKQPFDFDTRTEGFIAFSISKKNCMIPTFEVENEKIIIEGTFEQGTTISYADDDIAHILTDTFVLAPTFEYDIFNIEITEEISKTSIGIYLNFPEFGKIPKENYPEELAKRIDYVKKHPNSEFLFKLFVSGGKYETKEDMKLVFDQFSKELKESETGMYFQKYLTEIVLPITLDTVRIRNTATNLFEPVINDNSKYTLVIFSASWCGPCHGQIPLLKDIYKELSSKMEIVYISIDREEDVNIWNELMKKESIPWRSLIATDIQKKGLNMEYNIEGIPHSILIYPDGKQEIIDVRINSDRERLYQLLNK